MVCQVVVAVCVVLGFISHQTSAQWLGQTQMGGFGQSQAQMGGFGQSQAQMRGFGRSQAPTGRWGQSQAQTGGWGQSTSPALGVTNWFQQDDTRYLTCIAVNENNDDMRITFSLGTNPNNPWGGRMGMLGNLGARSLRLSARITSGGQPSSLQGRFRLAVTEFSRSEEVCLSRALGEILTDRTWWGQSSTPRGLIGTEVTIMQGQVYNSHEAIDNLEFNDLVGRGMLLCPSNMIRGSTCMDPVPLCCKLGYDTQAATTPFAQPGQFLPQGGLGFGNNNGLGGGLGQGMGGGFNPGMGGPMSQGLGGMNQGGMGATSMGQGGMRQGMSGLNNAGTGNIGGLTFQNVAGMQ